jgi:hypothetical protein
MVEVGQLRRWTYNHPPVPSEWYDEVFLVIEARTRWRTASGVTMTSWTIMIHGTVEGCWNERDLETMSEVIDEG